VVPGCKVGVTRTFGVPVLVIGLIAMLPRSPGVPHILQSAALPASGAILMLVAQRWRGRVPWIVKSLVAIMFLCAMLGGIHGVVVASTYSITLSEGVSDLLGGMGYHVILLGGVAGGLLLPAPVLLRGLVLALVVSGSFVVWDAGLTLERASGLFFEPSYAGLAIGCIGLAALLVVDEMERPPRLCTTGVVSLTLVAFALIRSKGALMSAALAAPGLLVGGNKRIGLVAVIVGAGVVGGYYALERAQERIDTHSSVATRSVHFLASVSVLVDRPLGLGVVGYKNQYATYVVDAKGVVKRWVPSLDFGELRDQIRTGQALHPKSHFAGQVMKYGLGGVALYFVLCAGLWRGVAARKHNRSLACYASLFVLIDLSFGSNAQILLAPWILLGVVSRPISTGGYSRSRKWWGQIRCA
jgi:hypothetical protein